MALPQRPPAPQQQQQQTPPQPQRQASARSPFAEPTSQIVSVTATVAAGAICKQCNATKCKHTHHECTVCNRLFLTAADLTFHKTKRGH